MTNGNEMPCWDAKSCPFCGWVPMIQHLPEVAKVVISCTFTRCGVKPHAIGATKRTALARWNRRAPIAKERRP
jgi:hypothetical protein